MASDLALAVEYRTFQLTSPAIFCKLSWSTLPFQATSIIGLGFQKSFPTQHDIISHAIFFLVCLFGPEEGWALTLSCRSDELPFSDEAVAQ